MTPAVRAALACAAGAVVVTSCGSAAASSPPVPAYEVRATTVGGLGAILADGAGRTLYLYTPDNRGPSVCTLGCLLAWPPLVLPKGVTKPVAGPGINPALLGTDRRPDGALQVTYNKWPLYLYYGDYRAGEVNGQADGMGLWWVVSVSGAVDRAVPTQAGQPAV